VAKKKQFDIEEVKAIFKKKFEQLSKKEKESFDKIGKLFVESPKK